jgi:Orsellinic acid/F9775 biosynthesis cluster protein D
MRWIICRRCDKSVPPEHIQGHLKKKHKIYCSDDTLNSITTRRRLMSLESITAWKKNTVRLEKAIGGILTRNGHKCVKCGHCTPVWGSMTDHFVKKHEGKEAKEWIEHEIEMQAPFSGQLKKWFPICDQSTVEIDNDNESAWKAVEVLLAKQKKQAMRPVNEWGENVRLINGFIACT